jgi:hypothetical protein
MRFNTFSAILGTCGLASSVLLLAGGAAFAQSVNLTAGSASAVLPDGQSVPMWGYTCGTTAGPDVANTPSCVNSNPTAVGWSPVVITVPAGPLTINLTNNLPAALPTSLVIVGQLGGGLGAPPTRTSSPAHDPQGTTWPGTLGTTGPGDAVFTPPPQAGRVQSFATEVATGATSSLCWGPTCTPATPALRPGTYLIESGTHPSIQGPMGLYGVLVVTDPANLYPFKALAVGATPFDKDVALLLSEIDPVQNAAVALAVTLPGFSETTVWSGKPGGCGNPATANSGNCYPPAVNYDPRYYLINGVSFDRSKITASTIVGPGAPATSGNVLLRFVNAGLRMHVPSVVGASLTLNAEDGNILPGTPKVQEEVFLAPGKTYDVTIQPKQSVAGTYDAATYAVYDRQLSLSTNNQRDGGMLAYVSVNGGTPATGTAAAVNAVDKTYHCTTGTPLVVSDPGLGVLGGSTYANGAVLGVVTPATANLAFQSNGTFTYTPPATDSCAASFTFLVNGTLSKTATIAQCDYAASPASTPDCAFSGAPTAKDDPYSSNIASQLRVGTPGVLTNDTDPSGLPLKASAPTAISGGSVTLNPDGSFTAVPACAPTCTAASTVTFQYTAMNSQNRPSAAATATVSFAAPSNLAFSVMDAKTNLPIHDYRWIIEEDRTFWIDPKCQINTSQTRIDSYGNPCPALPVESLGYNFHTANMPVVATGCVGAVSCESGQTQLGTTPVACDLGDGVCRTDSDQKISVLPSQVALDPAKRYYISILPGDGVNPVIGGAGGPDQNGVPFDIATACGPYVEQALTDSLTGSSPWSPGAPSGMCGHAMGGAQISTAQVAAGSATAISINLQQTPLPTAKIAVFVFEDDFPLNGENDAGGGVDVIAPNEPGLGGFEVKLFDQAGGLGDATGQITYDMFNMPVSNSLAGRKDPISGLDACPITQRSDGMVGMIPTCPKFEADGTTPSPLAGQAIIANLYPGLYEVVATPAADRIAAGEEWLQSNTLDGGKPHEAFIKPDEPSYFQEFGPGGFHVSIGFTNPKIINDRLAPLCAKLKAAAGNVDQCTHTLTGRITSTRMSRSPDQRLYSSGSYDAYGFTQCYVGLGSPDEPDFAFAKCEADGTFTMAGLPSGDFKLTAFDQWNDLMLDGLVSPVHVGDATTPIDFPVTQWRTNLYTRTYIDQNGDGVSQPGEPGLPLASTNIRYRDGSFGFFNNTDLDGYAGFNEVFPFMNWLVVETDSTRYKHTSNHVVYDAGGPADGSGGADSTIAAGLANTSESIPLPPALRVPGARYCASADCPAGDTAGGSSGRVDPAFAVTEGWQGLLGQNSFIEFGMKPFAAHENGGIRGHVIYASTRPFDDPSLSLQLSWEPGVPRVKLNLYQEGTSADGTKTLKLVDTTTSTSWDDWAQGFRSDGVPNMNCPGQDSTSPFFQTLKDSKQWLDPTKTALPNNSQFKCYDGWSQLNQIQPAPYDGMYKFPSVTAITPTGASAGLPAGTNCTVCIDNPTGDGTKMLPAGKYVVEVVLPSGFELVKEEDKNILLGDVYIAPVTQQFAGLGNIFIMPDQAAVRAYYNGNNPGGLNLTTNLGATPRHEGDTGSVESFWPCVGTTRIVPDYNSLFPGAGQAAPFAGASRPLCDRKEVILEDQAAVLTKFFVFTNAHIAGHFTGTITNDFASEFDPFSPQFGEKFGPPNLPVGIRDFTGKEVARVVSDQWGIYNGLNYSSYAVNPPNPTGYVPTMMIACMNDPGPIAGPGGTMITDPSYNPAYSNFCYETPFMPGFTAYMDTPVIPTQAFADGYNLPDSEYPDATPAIKSVLGGSGVAGPWVSGAGQTLTVNSLGDKVVQNPSFSGPNARSEPYNQKTITRHYGFGARPSTCPAAGACPNVTVAGVPMTNVSTWTDAQIIGAVPTIPSSASTCTIAQRGVTGPAANNYRCGELAITADNGKTSIDTITVTVAGKTPTYVTPTSPRSSTFGQTYPNPLQTAIDNATPGDLIIVGPGMYQENLLMWKPVRLQGVGAGSVTINADAHPAGKMDPWRRQVNCLFGLTVDGTPNLNNAKYDTTYKCPAKMFLRSDRLPFEGLVGWDASSNGNLAQVLQEPTLMGAYEGAGVTVLGRGVRIPNGSTDFWGQVGGAGTFPDGSVYLDGANNRCNSASTTSTDGHDYGTANFLCNPSRIDGVSIINSSQGGGGIFMHGWNHNLEVSNNRIYGNHGTLAGGINMGNGETPPVYFNDGTICGNGVPNPAPLCPPIPNGTPANAAIPFALNVNLHVHHNAITNNASIGDALFSGTPSGSGGVTISAGDDNYRLDHNWISGNLSSGDGGGVGQDGLSFNGRISNNWILFNQSVNPTLPTNGGGLAILGSSSDRTLPDGTECGTTTDVDCPPGIGDGTGPGLVIDANLIMGNSAESGSGGGLRLQQVNGTEMGIFPLRPDRWYGVTVTNNIITNNVAGWDGGGVSLQDALKVTFVNNTVASNDTTASAGVLFKTLAAINSSAPPPGCTPTADPSQPQNPNCLDPNAPHVPQPAGLVTMENTPNLKDSLPAIVICPPGFGYTNGNGTNSCKNISRPVLTNDMFWQNRAFHVDIVSVGSGLQSQQNLIALTPLLDQTVTGDCPAGASGSYWDIGVRGDTSPTNHGGGATLTLGNSILTSNTDYPGNVQPGASPVIAQYCNGARVPPENCSSTDTLDKATCKGYNAPAGRSETTGLSPVFVFDGITPAATVDEGHNWINLTFGPLSLFSTAGQSMLASATVGSAVGAYSIPGTSAAVDNGTNTNAPAADFFGNPRARTAANRADIGAVEYMRPAIAVAVVTPASVAFGNVVVNTTSASQTVTLSNNGGAAFTGINVVVTAPFARVPGGCTATLNAGATCTITVTFSPTALGVVNGSATITGNVGVLNSPVALSGTGVAATYTASVTPSPLAFGNWATGTTSSTRNLTVTNTGNSSLAGLTYTFGGGTPQPFTRVITGAFPGGAPNCGATLAVGAACTVKVQFAPATAVAFSRTLTVAGTGATVTPTPVTLTGTGVAARATVSIVPNPLTITLPSGNITGTGTVTLTNTAPAGTGASMTVSGVNATGGSLMTFFFNDVFGSDACTGTTLAPQASCTVLVRFTNVASPRGVNRAGTITFTDNAATATQSGALVGFATP